MKLTSLEIERSRRITERDAMNTRIRLLDERLADIEAEQATLNTMLTERMDAAKASIDASPKTNVSDSGNFRY